MTRDWKDVKAEKVDHNALVSRVAEVLGVHRVRAEFWHDVFTCDGCDWRTHRAAPEEVAQRHRAHLATVLAELVQSERAAAAVEALESAADDEVVEGWEVEHLAKVLHGTVRDFGGGLDWSELGEFSKANYRDRAAAYLIGPSATYRSTNTTPTKETQR